MSACVDLGLVVFGYLPAFVSVVVKSQRSFIGDLFLVIVAVFWLMDLVNNDWIKRAPLWSLLAVLLCASDAYYLYFTLSVDHSRNHYPRLDYDRADGIARHDLTAAIEAMKRQVEQDGAVVVIYYPQEYSENTTDPAVFFARFLRHFGPYRDRAEPVNTVSASFRSQRSRTSWPYIAVTPIQPSGTRSRDQLILTARL